MIIDLSPKLRIIIDDFGRLEVSCIGIHSHPGGSREVEGALLDEVRLLQQFHVYIQDVLLVVLAISEL